MAATQPIADFRNKEVQNGLAADHGGHDAVVGNSAQYATTPSSQVPQHRKFANPAPLGLSAFALTTFVLSLINLRTRGVNSPNIVVALAFGYGGLVQLLAGMWYVLLS